MTWNTTASYLIVKCIVPDLKRNILIVDPFGKNRGQCILKDWPLCVNRYKYDFIYMEKFQRSMTVALMTTRHNDNGEWKCRYGKKETIAKISYKEGNLLK